MVPPRGHHDAQQGGIQPASIVSEYQPDQAPSSDSLDVVSSSSLEVPSRQKRQRVATDRYQPTGAARTVTPRKSASSGVARPDTVESSQSRNVSAPSQQFKSPQAPRTTRASAKQVSRYSETEPVVSSTSASSSQGDFSDNELHTDDTNEDEAKVKTERDAIMNQAVEFRKYGDRVLVGRQRSNGLMKLGGGNATMILYPGKQNQDHPRFQDVGYRKAICYNDSWQPFGPQYAGQPSAHVGTVPDEHQPFSVFMRRGELGCEYCGEYRLADPERDIITFTAAHTLKQKDKSKMIRDIMDSLQRANGEWKDVIQSYRVDLTRALQEDNSPAGPEWLKEGRKPTMDETEQKRPSLAARLRALGYAPGMPNEPLVELLVELDEFHETDAIIFVEYSEKIYDYIKGGETTRNSAGKSRKRGERCAIASDWYARFDQLV